MRTNEPHVPRLGVFIRDEGSGQHPMCVTLIFTTWSCMLLRRDQAAVVQVERQVFSQICEWGLCTKGLVMFDVAMEYHGNRFRRSEHSMASLAPLKEMLFDPTQVQLPDNTRVDYDRVVEDTKL